MKCLALFDCLEAVAESRRGELIEIAACGLLLLGKHPAFTRADTRPRHLRTRRERDFGFLAQSAEAHVAHEERDVQDEGLLGARTDDELGADGSVVEKRQACELRRQDLDVVPARERVEANAHGGDRSVMPRFR